LTSFFRRVAPLMPKTYRVDLEMR